MPMSSSVLFVSLCVVALSKEVYGYESEVGGVGRRLQQHSHPYDFLIPYHGWFMTTAFAIIMPAAILIPILFKRTKYWGTLVWLHAALQVVNVLFITAGVAMGAKLNRNSTPQYVHRGIGIAVIIIVWLQVVFALSTRPFLAGRQRAKGAYNVIHRWAGATAFIVGVGNAYYGMMISAPATRYFVGYSVALGGWILIAMFGELFVYSAQARNGLDENSKYTPQLNGTVARAETRADAPMA